MAKIKRGYIIVSEWNEYNNIDVRTDEHDSVVIENVSGGEKVTIEKSLLSALIDVLEEIHTGPVT